MKRASQMSIRVGDQVEIRYTGKGQGKIAHGIVRKVHSDSYDIELVSYPYGIKFSVPRTIVHTSRDKSLIARRFVPQYDITYPFVLLPGDACSLYERKRFKRFISYKQHRAFLTRFRSAWRAYHTPVAARDFMEYRP